MASFHVVSQACSALAIGGLLAVIPVDLPAQEATAGLSGRVFDERTNEPLSNILVFVNGAQREVTVSGQGRFVVLGLAAGVYEVEVRSIGYRPYLLRMQLSAGATSEGRFPMIFTGDQLPDISVEGRHSRLLPRFADFERRRTAKMGHFITRDEIRARGYMRLSDALKMVRGVKVDCSEIDCLIRMARAPHNCGPTYYVDGRLTRSFAESTALNDVQGIEVYRGASEMPGEFSGSGAMCGVIVIWTRAAP